MAWDVIIASLYKYVERWWTGVVGPVVTAA